VILNPVSLYNGFLILFCWTYFLVVTMPSLRVAAAALLTSSALANSIHIQRNAVSVVVDSETLQAGITQEILKKRAEQLYELARASEEEYGHPTRAIGTPGTLFAVKRS
jgi:precorrin isomerase